MRGKRFGTVPVLAGGSLLLALASVPAAAVDGVLEINQACAAAGCFPGDAAGFPVSITQPGSYRLTGNLTVPDANTTAIEISASAVSVDLNGFAVTGVTSCSGLPVSCSPTGSGVGIDAALNTSEITVHDGSVHGMGATGIDLHSSNHIRVAAIAATNNGDRGVDAGFAGVLDGVAVSFNGGDGIFAGDRSTVSNSVATNNGGNGIIVTSRASVLNCAASTNDSAGIVAAAGAIVSGCRADNNTGNGISVEDGGLATGNTSTFNGNFGLVLGDATGYKGNVIGSNGGGTVFAGVELGMNLCGSNTTCP